MNDGKQEVWKVPPCEGNEIALYITVGAAETVLSVTVNREEHERRTISFSLDALDDAIRDGLLHRYNLQVGAELPTIVRYRIGSAVPLEPEEEAEIRGRDAATGIPQAILLTSEDVRAMLAGPVDALLEEMERITREVLNPLEGTKVSVLIGMDARLYGLGKRIAAITGMPIAVVGSFFLKMQERAAEARRGSQDAPKTGPGNRWRGEGRISLDRPGVARHGRAKNGLRLRRVLRERHGRARRVCLHASRNVRSSQRRLRRPSRR